MGRAPSRTVTVPLKPWPETKNGEKLSEWNAVSPRTTKSARTASLKKTMIVLVRADSRIDEMQWGRVQPVDAQDRDVVVTVERGCVCTEALAVDELDQGVVLTCDDVGGRNDEPAPADPAGPFDAQAAGCAEDAHHARSIREDGR